MIFLTEVLIHDFMFMGSLQGLHALKSIFPSCWWMIFRGNDILEIHSDDFYAAMGLLDLSKNHFTLENILSNLATKHIMRLTLANNTKFDSASPIVRKTLVIVLKNVWVLDDDFICAAERRSAKQFVSVQSLNISKSKVYMDGDWTGLDDRNERVSILLGAVQELPENDEKADLFKLEILLEDYFEEARIFNRNCTTGNTRNPKEPKHKHVPQIGSFLQLPHHIRLDLTVVLTCTILYDLPLLLLVDALTLLLHGHMAPSIVHTLCTMPRFIRTALVCILRTVTAKERQELAHLPTLLKKPANNTFFTDANDPFIPTFTSVQGFQHLRAYKEYIALDINDVSNHKFSSTVHSEHFSELENEILDTLPNTPTYANRPDDGTAGFRDWVSFAARHTILILKKSPACPPLTKPLQQQSHQDMYSRLLPVLRAAGMTYRDLDIELTGPSRDGRSMKSMKGIDNGGNVLGFGQGLPNSVPNHLIWNTNEPVSVIASTQQNLQTKVPNYNYLGDSSIDLTENSVSMHEINHTKQLSPGNLGTSSALSYAYSSDDTISWANIQTNSASILSEVLPEHSKSSHAPVRQGGYLSVEGPTVYNLLSTASSELFERETRG